MTGFLLRRLTQAVVVVVLVAVVTFVLLHLLPGGPARAILGPRATALQIQTFLRDNGYDRPLVFQFLRWLGNVLHGDLGYSYQLNEPVTTLIADRLPKTLLLMTLSTVVALVLAVPIGVYQARKRNSPGDYAVTGLSFMFYSMPSFFLAEILILVFAIQLHWFSPLGPNGDSLGAILAQAPNLILPVVTLALITVASFSRYVRSSVLENLGQDYVRTALAGGASDGRVIMRHVLRNSLIPVVTLLGISLPQLFAGALITEQVFNYPGMGFAFVQGAQVHDYPTLLGIGLVVAVATVAGSLLADIGYAVLDPRVRY
ncbi:MAG TPA: ABC transporter permease [Amycolatopsis sp.]|jgi:peptide/nickel transport system permease protein|nr:ABC transporter permease [Amycolatopsis sp.]